CLLVGVLSSCRSFPTRRSSDLAALTRRLGEYGIASWTMPEGGYFIDLEVVDGTATETVRLAKGLGVALTPAGSAYPYGNDPDDRDRKSTRLNSSHVSISYAVFC